MRQLICTFLFLLAFTTGSTAQVLLQVTESAAGQPLPGVIVRFKGGIAGETDASGRLTLTLPEYPASLELQGLGLETVRIKVGGPGSASVRMARRTQSLEGAVVTGVPRPTPLKNALSLYRVINRADNDAQGNINLAEALSTQLNINMGSDQLLGSTIRMQGLSGNKVKVLIDGLPVNGRENGNIDMGQLSLNNVERVEIVQGPMSVVYGSDALGGVINLITRQSRKPWEAAAGFNYESIGRYNADASVTRNWRHHHLNIGGGRNFFRGWKDLDTVTAGYVPHRQLLWKPKEQYLANAGYTYAADSGFRLQLLSDLVREKVTNKGAASVTAYEGYAFDEYYRTTRSSNRLVLEGRLGKKGHWESRNGYALYHRVREQVRKDLVSLEEVRTTAAGTQDTSTFHDVTLRSNYSNSFGRLKFDGGYDINLSYAHSGKIPGGTRSISDYALYENISYTLLNERLTLQAGFREVHNTAYNAPLIYSLQALYAPRENVQLRASYGKAFRAPSLKEQYLEFIDNNHHITGNPDLKAESGDVAQASASWQVYRRRSDYFQLILNGYYNNVYNQIVLVNQRPQDSNSIDYTYANFEHQRNTVWNLQAEQQWRNLHVVIGYGLTYTWADPGYYDAFTSQELTASGNYYWSAPKLTFNAFYKLTGATPNVAPGIEGKAVYNGNLPAYSLLDASVERRFWKRRIQVIAGVKNILDVRQVTTSGSTGSGGGHDLDNRINLLPRRFFTTVRLSLN